MDIINFLKEKKLIELNNQQQQGVLSFEKNTLLLAVPGSGKTTVLVSRIANLMLNHSVSSDEILTLTYNRETAKDMKIRFLSLFGKLVEDSPQFSTIHSFCLSVMNFYSQKYNRIVPDIIEQARFKNKKSQALREIYRHYNDEFISEDNYDTLERLICYAKNMMLPQSELETKKFEINNFAKIFLDYEAFKRKNKFIDFDDMLTLTYDILCKFSEITEHFQTKYKFINVDEAQDTSYVQHKIIEILSKKSRIFMVGDEDQSIYSFRGAYPQALLQFDKLYNESLIIKMEQNFRSNQDIVASANEFIKQNRQRFDKEMFCENENKNSIEFVKIEDYADQAKAVLKLIKGFSQDCSIAVIYKNNESAIPLINLFYEQNINFYIKEHHITYFSSSVMRDIIAYMQIAIDQTDIEAFSQIYYKLGYSKGIFEFVRDNLADYDGIFDAVLRVSTLSDYKRNQTRSFITLFPRLLKKSPASAIEFIQTDLNYDSYIENRMADGFTKTNTYQKLNTAKALSVGLKDIYEFLDKLQSLENDIQKGKNIDKDANITLTTMHSSKGLEFDIVVMLDVIRDIIPSSDAVNEKMMGHYAEYEDEVRLFYVAMTRAKKKLIIYFSNLINGALISPSVFLNKLLPPDNLGKEIVGCDVLHEVFGEGKAVKLDSDLVTIDFKKYGKKTFSLSICLQRNLMQISRNKT